MKNQNDSHGDFEAEDGYDENVPDASELLDFELIAKSPQEKSSGLWLWLVLIVVLAGGGWAGWMYLQDADDMASRAPGNVPVIEAPKFALKEKPADPGGMSVPDRDKLVYDRMAGDQVTGSGAQVERLLPPPETPLEPPKSITPQNPPAAPTQAQTQTPPQPPAPTPKPVEEVAKAAPTPAPPPAPSAPVAKVEPKPAPKPAPEPVAKVEPKPAPKSAPKPAPVAAAPKATGTAGQGYMIQLSAVRNEANAKGEWARLSKKHPDILGGLELVVQRADLGAKGVFYRVRGGWFATRGEAKAVCDALKTRSVGCLIAKP